ncbi:DNA polymerase-3 subunit delta' [Cruoricaptor ignavus]|uniref:DNA polymerase-3 subunit delta n=2 Tax=Cruoricaptor ignavus TaxID=1118202 RepID=A0A1M6BLM4_9FLAO|nr:DNA polymerase-3 subunit delta' [Cruoricaptor ignavus]
MHALPNFNLDLNNLNSKTANPYLWKMVWENIVGQGAVKNALLESIAQDRVGHAHLFIGKDGYGSLPLALAFAREILSRENPDAAERVDSLNHIDLHLSFPTFNSAKTDALSKNYLETFREALTENPYLSLNDWMTFLDAENKQLLLSVKEISSWVEDFALKSYEGGSKILIVWNADKMQAKSSNKLLKFLEEPPEKTLIILTAETEDNFLPTILSRTQITKIPRIEDAAIENYLAKNFDLPDEQLKSIVFQSQGDLNSALKLANSGTQTSEFETLFVQWVREAFMVKNKPELLRNIISWARDIASWNREKQKQFLEYCAKMFRLALMQNYGLNNLVYSKITMSKFNWEAFSKFVHGANISNILEELSDADFHLQRNANPKIVWTDVGIKLSRYIHIKA